MRRKLIGLLVLAILIVMSVPAFATDNTQDKELQALYSQMQELQQKIAEKNGNEYDEGFFQQMYDYCNGMMGGYGMMRGYGTQNSSYGMMGW